MARTKAQKSRSGRQNYGQNYGRGRQAEHRAARTLRAQGYRVQVSQGSRGPADLIARQGNQTRRIQVKQIDSRTITSAAVARRRVQGQPFNVPAGREVWLYNKNRRFIFRA